MTRPKPQVSLNLVDKAIGYFSPASLTRRVAAKAALNQATQLGYIVPGSKKKTMKGVTASANSPHVDTVKKLSSSRAINRDMVMNIPIAKGALDRIGSNTVGSGLIPQINPDWEYLGISEEESQKWAKRLEKRFDIWASSTSCDFYGLHNFYDLQWTAFASVLLNGDVTALHPWVKDARNKMYPWELKIQLLEADLIKTPQTYINREFSKKDIVGGVEFRKGRLHSIHVAKKYDTDAYSFSTKGLEDTKEIKLFDSSGRQNFYLLLPPGMRIGQRRGMGVLAASVDLLKTMTNYREAFLVGQLVSNLFNVFIKDSTGLGGMINPGYTPEESKLGGGTEQDADGNQTTYENDPENQLDLELGTGVIHYLDDKKDISFADPKRDPSGFEPYYHMLIKELASSLGLSAEQLLIEFNTSYTAAKAGLQESWKMFKRYRLWLSRNFNQPVLESFIEEEVAKGNVIAKGFLEDITMRKAWSRCMWIGPGQGQIDPQKEAKSSVIKIQNNLSSHEEEYTADKGSRWDESMHRKKQEISLLKELDLFIDVRVPDTEELPGDTGTDTGKEAGVTKV